LQYADNDQKGIKSSSPWSVRLSIVDNGRGFDLDQAPHNRLGLGIMYGRAQAIGAKLSIESRPDGGTQVCVVWGQGEKA
jgi:nitrate/nitrite-specific signal transduction histidine kinase